MQLENRLKPISFLKFGKLTKGIELIRNGRFFSNVATTLIAKILSLSFGVANAVIITRWIGPEGKGVIALVMLLPETMSLFLSMGINLSSVWYIGSKKLSISEVSAVSLFILIVIVLFGVVGIIVLLLTGWINAIVPRIPTSFWLFVLVAYPISLIDIYYGGILQGLQKIKTLNLLTFSHSIFILGGMLFLVIYLHIGALGAILAYILGSIAKVFISGYILYKEGAAFKPKYDFVLIRKMLFYGLRGHIGNVVHFFNYRLDMYIVNFFLNPLEVGLYTISVRMAELLWVLPRSVAFVIFPKAAATKKTLMNSFTPRIFYGTLITNITAAIGLTVFGSDLIEILFGEVFIKSYKPMMALLPGAVFLGSTKVLTSEIAGRGYPEYNSVSAGIAFILTVVLDLWLIPRYGILGASIASSVSYTSVSILSLIFYLFVRRKI